ncbi:MAG: hypothetical protein J5J06_13320 [Phycisphaerae bacterium]|nr:hypothetical protein [Phycisphaerae bacterium]
MIALCRSHHDHADAGGFSKDELRTLKSGSFSAESVKARFPWAKRAMLIRLGGCYSGGSSAVLSVSGNPIIRVTTGESGLLLLSFLLKSPDGAVVAHMTDNIFQSDPAALHDLKCKASATSIKVWLAPRDIGLDLTLKRITIDDLDGVLARDRERAENSPAAKRALEEWECAMNDLPAPVKESLSNREQFKPRGMDGLPQHIQEAILSGDPTGTITKHWATQHCLDDEGKLALLDFTNLAIHERGRCIRICNGFSEGPGLFAYNAAFSCAGSYYL